ILGSHPEENESHEEVQRYVSYGASPRGLQALIRGARLHCILDGRTVVAAEDIRRVALPSLRHRLILNFQGEAESLDLDELILKVIDSTGD
ncbi:MAG: AAA family ATPase, partial [Verrucomicrobiota bacterium]